MGKRKHETPPQTLGQFLANLRLARRMTLREVEEATDRQVSNAYLSQLEHDRISKPSPNVLFHLAMVYTVPYELLMEKAGYLVAPVDSGTESRRHGRVATFADKNLTAEEEEALLDYLGYLRMKRRKLE